MDTMATHSTQCMAGACT